MDDFKKNEEKILKFWGDSKIFEKSLAQRKGAKPFVFYEGPPTANGLPHIGHLLTRIFKDLYGRYKTMRGYYVLRRAGWDTHGLPVEIEVEKQLGLKTKKDIEEFGIARFNKKARESAQKYKAEWERMTERMGFWLDLDNPYITYRPDYIESVWAIIKKIWDKKLLYQGHKVIPFCTRCGTPLSSHEVAQGYEDITETAVIVKLKIKEPLEAISHNLTPNTYFLAWTTTPWTLPGNVALAVGESIKYLIVSIKGGNEKYVLAEDRAEKVLNAEYEILDTVSGKDLVGLEYEPLFDVAALKSKNSYKVYPADFVTTEEGTGIVHTAVMYGEEDYELGKKVGLPTRHTVDEQGRFTADVAAFSGQYVKDAEPGIVKYLRDKNRLFKEELHLHTYPFCWRCHTPLLYYATDSWFIKMSARRQQLLKNNRQINWKPKHMKEGRFGEFIKETKDWALSRKRYWGTPLPIWQCANKHHLVVSALADLERHRFRPANTYYLIRHGTSTKNVVPGKDIISSKLEKDAYELTSQGRAEVKETARQLKRANGADLIISSPFLRTKQTAQIIADYLNQPVKIDKRLKEIDLGSANEGRLYDEAIPPVPDFETKLDDGESRHDVRRRVWSLIRELEEKYSGKKIILVSHGDPIWLLDGLSRNLDEPAMLLHRAQDYLKKGGVRKVTFANYPRNEDGEVDLHRPYVDEIALKCPECNEAMRRVPDLIDVWFDSGAMPLAQWHYPFENKKLVDSGQQYPADFIVEAIDQTRGWFYTMLAIATASGRKPPYKNVMVLGHTLDEKGRKMSKSKGNVIMAHDILEQFGADVVRWYLFTLSDPADGKPISPKDIAQKYRGFFGTLQNTLRFFELYASSAKPSGSPEPQSELDQWLFARLAQLTATVTENLDAYAPTIAARAIEEFVVDDLSNWWVRRSRKRFQHPVSNEELVYVASILRYALLELAKIIALFIPFTAEWLHSELHRGQTAGTESVHLHDWPLTQLPTTNHQLLTTNMEEVRKFVAAGLGERKAKNIKVRQPLAGATLKRAEKFAGGLEELIKDELNIKTINYNADAEAVIALDERITEDLIREGWAREAMRQIQDMRKEVKYKLNEKVFAAWETDNAELATAMKNFSSTITTDTLLKSFIRGHQLNLKYDVEKDFNLAEGVKIWLGVRK
ncbi:MAG: class I tRNA ligase family protein [Patescibacteria group bacterium]